MKFLKTKLTRQIQEGNAYQLRTRRNQSRDLSKEKGNKSCA